MHSVYITKYHRKILDAAPLDWLAGHAQQVLAKMDCRLLSSAIWWRPAGGAPLAIIKQHVEQRRQRACSSPCIGDTYMGATSPTK
jgi:hypothetical protein